MVTPETAVVGIEAIWPGQIQVFDGSGKQELAEYYWSIPQNRNATTIGELQLGTRLGGKRARAPRERCAGGCIPFGRRGFCKRGKLGTEEF